MKDKSKKNKKVTVNPKEVLIISNNVSEYSRLKEGLEANGFKILERPVQNGVIENVEADFFKTDILERSKKLITSNTVIILVDLFLRPNEEFVNGASYYHLKDTLTSIAVANELNGLYQNIPVIFMGSKAKGHKTMNSFFRCYKNVDQDWLLLEKPNDGDLSLNKNVFYVYIKALAKRLI
jgi:hypothetical protein